MEPAGVQHAYGILLYLFFHPFCFVFSLLTLLQVSTRPSTSARASPRNPLAFIASQYEVGVKVPHSGSQTWGQGLERISRETSVP